MAFCTSCGSALPPGSPVCPGCGRATGMPQRTTSRSPQSQGALPVLLVVLLVLLGSVWAYWATVRAEQRAEAIRKATAPPSMQVDAEEVLRASRAMPALPDPAAMAPMGQAPAPGTQGKPPTPAQRSKIEADANRRADAMAARLQRNWEQLRKVQERGGPNEQAEVDRIMKQMQQHLR